MIESIFEAKIICGAVAGGSKLIHVTATDIGTAAISVMQYRDQHLHNGSIAHIRLIGVLNVSSKDVMQ